ncbi:MAG: hypothetical protein EBT07_01535 [Actinobacteria bacterium]|nr:hypothetical protein [Actinomycetota bacterium]
MAKFGVDPHGKWDKNLAQEQFQGHVENIVRKYSQADPEMLKKGNDWYPRAHEIAHEVGGGDVHKGAGVIAALSPMNNWGRNVSEAKELVKTGNVAKALLPANVTKARRIHEGEDPNEVLGGNKVKSFYHNISDPSNPHHVTIDRHAHDIAVGNPFVGAGGGKAKRNITKGPSGHTPMSEDLGLDALGRYKHFENAYKIASGKLDIAIPNRVQSITWSAHRGTAE